MSGNNHEMGKAKPVAGIGSGAYTGLVGLGDTNRLDSSLYDEQVDFDFFETGGAQLPEPEPIPVPKTVLVDTVAEGGNIGTDTGAGANAGLTVTVDPPTPAALPYKSRLLLQIAPTQSPAEGKVPFSTQLLMAALQDTNADADAESSGSGSGSGSGLGSNLNQQQERERQQCFRVHLFDLTDSEEDDEANELELAEINGQAQAAAGCGDKLHSWEDHDFYHHQHLQQQQQHERAQRQKKKHRAHAAAAAGAGGQGQLGILDLKSMADDYPVNVESSDDDEEGYYLSDSERSDITDVTPMSSVACSPMPQFATNTNGTPYPAHGITSESDDSYDGYPINHEGPDDDQDDNDVDDEELRRIPPSEDDDDIDEILRILPDSTTGQSFEISTEGNVDPFMKMYRDGPNSPAVGGDEAGDQPEQDYQYTLNAVSAGLDRHYYSMSPGHGHGHGHGEDESDAGRESGRGDKQNSAGAGNGNGNNLLTVNYGNTSKSYVDAQRKRMLAAAHAHHSVRHGHHGMANGAGPKLNKVHHPTTNGYGHHHHNHHGHGPGSLFHGNGHGGHHFNHHHGHGHYNNYHQQYHNLTVALQRKRQTQQKQIEYDNSILKRKIQNVKPSLDIMKAFGPVSTAAVTVSSSSTSSSSAGGTPAPSNSNKKGGGDYTSSTASSVCGCSSTSTTTSSSSSNAGANGSRKN